MKGYSPFKAYTRIDRTNSEYVKSFDLQKFCNQQLPYGVDKLTEFDCNFIIRQFDRSRSGYLVYEDFRQLILPREILKADPKKEMKAKKTPAHLFLAEELEIQLREVLKLEINFLKELEQRKLELERLP